MSGVRAGLYEGAGTPLGDEVRLRVQRGPAGSLSDISGDVVRGDQVFSFIGRGSIVESQAGIEFDALLFAADDTPGGTTRFRLAPGGVADEVSLSGDVGGGPGVATLGLTGSALRRLTLVIDALEGLDVPDPSLLTGTEGATLVSCLASASIAVAPEPLMRVRPDTSNRRTHTPAELHALMTAWGQPPTRHFDPWWLHVLFAGRFDGRGYGDVSGVMYDVSTEEDKFPRQGVAVFLGAEGIARHPVGGADWRREVLFTLVHEIGHGLNLPHSFDEGRNDALSWMNYPQRVGLRAFWRGFKDSFDERELRFLCHAPHIDVAPGACSYAVRRSDLLGGGDIRDTALRHMPVATEEDEGARPVLTLEPLKKVYGFGEPVFLRLALRNDGDKPLRYAKAFDPSDGLVTITVTGPLGESRVIRSALALCQNHRLRRLGPGRTVDFDGIFAAFDADGPIFEEPGRYSLEARFAGVPGTVVSCAPSRLRVLYPTREEELVALMVWDDPKLMRAIQLRQPLLAHDNWKAYVAAAERLLPADPTNTTLPFLGYTAALGWTTPHKPACLAHTYEADPAKALSRLRSISLSGLPRGAARRKSRLGGLG